MLAAGASRTTGLLGLTAAPVHGRRGLAAVGAIALPLVAGVAFLAAPGELDEKLMLALRGVCAQRPDHGFLVDGAPLALEARMYGIFAGFSVAVGIPWLRGHCRRAELPRGAVAGVLIFFVLSLLIDGMNALLYAMGSPHLYVPRNDLRLVTGLLGGVGLAGYAAPVVSFVWWREREPVPLYSSWTDVVWSLGAAALLAALVLGGLPSRTALSALGLLAVVGSFWLVSTYVAALLWHGSGAADTWGDLAGPSLFAFAVSLGELAGLGALRNWMEVSFGISWVV